MADDIDDANDMAELRRAVLVKQTAKDIPLGTPGDCDMCGEWCGRLIGGACPPCRDHFRLP